VRVVCFWLVAMASCCCCLFWNFWQPLIASFVCENKREQLFFSRIFLFFLFFFRSGFYQQQIKSAD
jgi:hypothetical protein